MSQASVWIVFDNSDYYGPDFDCVFATKEAAERYVDGSHWLLIREQPLRRRPPRKRTVYKIAMNRQFPWDPWPNEAPETEREVWEHKENFEMYPLISTSSHHIRVESFSKEQTRELFTEKAKESKTWPNRESYLKHIGEWRTG